MKHWSLNEDGLCAAGILRVSRLHREIIPNLMMETAKKGLTFLYNKSVC